VTCGNHVDQAQVEPAIDTDPSPVDEPAGDLAIDPDVARDEGPSAIYRSLVSCVFEFF
jgi:hypothetical protein